MRRPTIGRRRRTMPTTPGTRTSTMATRTTTTRTTPTTCVASGDGIPQGFDIDNGKLTFEELAIAYFDCRRNKRNSVHARIFEFDLERNLFELYEELLSGDYRIGRTVAFVVENPKVREIWASTFRDRVVHHVIYNRLAPDFILRLSATVLPVFPGGGLWTAPTVCGPG